MIDLDSNSPEPPFVQVREQIRAQVEAGGLAPGTRLPTVRGLAKELGIAANTVARAYRDLESLGLIETRGRAGSVVAGHGVDRAAREAASDYAARMRELGVDPAAAVELARAALNRS